MITGAITKKWLILGIGSTNLVESKLKTCFFLEAETVDDKGCTKNMRQIKVMMACFRP